MAKRGGPPRVCRCDRASPGELRLTVRTASPAMRTRSASPNSVRWPGVWPGVGMTCQSGRPGTPTFGSIGLSPGCPGGNIQRRSTRAKAPMMRPEAGNGSSSGCTYTVTSHMRASSEAEPAWSGCTCVSTIARGRAPAPNRVSAALLISSARPRHAVSTRTQVPPDCTKATPIGGYRAAAVTSDYDALLRPIRSVSALPNRSVSLRGSEPTLPRPD